MEGILTDKHLEMGRHALEFACAHGASAVRIALNSSLSDLVAIRDGAVDKVSHSLDRSMTVALFADGRFGTFSLNRMDDKPVLEAFLLKALETVRMLVPDPCRVLPGKERKVKDAVTGEEAGLIDREAYEAMDAEKRRRLALSASLWSRKAELEKGFTLLSEECEYSDGVSDLCILDSDGLFCRHTETSFEIACEMTIADPDGNRLSGSRWDADARLEKILPSLTSCPMMALEDAVSQIGPKSIPGGKYNVVFRTGCSSKLLNPILSALNGYSLQQNNSFLLDSAGKRIFSEKCSVLIQPRAKGAQGSRWFDSEGVATANLPLIDKGVVCRYFVNSYIAGKTGLAPSIDDPFRLVVAGTGDCVTEADTLSLIGDGILVTGFNGGNSNPATGDFSYGIEGFAFSGGKITHPVREMLMTGNFITLWQNLAAVADDARSCLTRRIPTIAFTGVDIR